MILPMCQVRGVTLRWCDGRILAWDQTQCVPSNLKGFLLKYLLRAVLAASISSTAMRNFPYLYLKECRPASASEPVSRKLAL